MNPARLFAASLVLMASAAWGAVGMAGTVLQVDVNWSGADTQSGFQPLLQADNVGGGDDGLSKSFGAITVDIDAVGTALDGRVRATPVNAGPLTQAAIYRDFTFSPGSDSTAKGLDTTITGLKPGQLYDVTLWSYDVSSTGARRSDWTVSGGLGPLPAQRGYSFDGSVLPTADGQDTIRFSAYADKTGQLVISGRAAAGVGAGSHNVFLNGIQLDERTDWRLVLAVDFNSTSAPGATNTQPGFDEFLRAGTGTTTRTFGPINVTLSGVNTGVDDRRRTLVTNGGAFTQQELLRDFVFASTFSGVDEGLDVLVEGLTPGQPYQVTLWSFDESSDGARTSDWSVNGRLVAHWSFDGADVGSSPTTPAENKYFFSFVAAADANGKLLISARATPGENVPAVFLNAMAIAEVPEPATIALFGVGLALLIPTGIRRVRRTV